MCELLDETIFKSKKMEHNNNLHVSETKFLPEIDFDGVLTNTFWGQILPPKYKKKSMLIFSPPNNIPTLGHPSANQIIFLGEHHLEGICPFVSYGTFSSFHTGLVSAPSTASLRQTWAETCRAEAHYLLVAAGLEPAGPPVDPVLAVCALRSCPHPCVHRVHCIAEFPSE